MSKDADPTFEALLDHLRQSRGFDFSGYKRLSLMRRFERRVAAVQAAGFAEYQDYLEVHPEEFAQLFNTILINVTAFFRDAAAWEYLAREIVPKILEGKTPDDPIRVWSAGCASGEEAYTLAILLAEALGPEAFRRRVKIFATDVDEDALNHARQAAYAEKDIQAISPGLRETYFEPANGRFVFRAEFRREVIFGRHDLVQDAPISRLDLLVCRNILMYFNAETQSKILARLHFALGASGYLFLGNAEMLITHTNLFRSVNLTHRIFARTPKADMRDRLLVLAQAGDVEVANQLGQQMRLREAAFDAGPVAQVVVDLNGELVLANGRARALVNVAPKDLGRPLQDLELSYRPVELRSLVEQAYAEHRVISLSSVERRGPDDGVQFLDVRVAPLAENGDVVLGASITFEDVTHRQKLQADLQRSTQELETASEELQAANEELETTNEELQSTNEELETTNEELQSTNEELETMNEELHSTNEELETMNTELLHRTEESQTATAFLQSILTSLRVGVAVVDPQLAVLVWNRRAEDLWGLRAEEVQGKPLLGLDIGLPVGRLPLAGFLDGTASYQEETLDATTRRGKAIRCHVTCTPFLGPGGGRAGVVLLMEEVGP
jgi:two-component system, chemotaxis family, CheB/CheR fusion protein